MADTELEEIKPSARVWKNDSDHVFQFDKLLPSFLTAHGACVWVGGLYRVHVLYFLRILVYP